MILSLLGSKIQGRKETEEAIDRFSVQGLRTLLLAKKKLS